MYDIFLQREFLKIVEEGFFKEYILLSHNKISLLSHSLYPCKRLSV